jgi:hypothetical protein
MHLEFTYLSDITGNPIYRSKVNHVRKILNNLEKPKGLYPNYIHPKTGKWGRRKYFIIYVLVCFFHTFLTYLNVYPKKNIFSIQKTE